MLQEEIKIQQVLESESNQESEEDKSNRVDLLVENQKGELVIIEVQNSKEFDYFHRMVYGAAKVITEHIAKGQPYAQVKKVIAITVAYFDLGQGDDYVYHGISQFKGIHHHDTLQLAPRQRELYKKNQVHDIFPEYWIIKAEKFDDQVSDKLDEWIYFLKNSQILDSFTAPGMAQAREKLDELKMSFEERKRYNRFLDRLRDKASYNYNRRIEYEDKLEEERKRSEAARRETEEIRLKVEAFQKETEEIRKMVEDEKKKSRRRKAKG
ncbi:MAG: hypothetical protein HC842_03455 [Cytophagales bacterium]|nr:hypothetical protein [Cytophagales bacterium]